MGGAAAPPMAALASMPMSSKSTRGRGGGGLGRGVLRRKRTGTANAARVSRGSEVDTWAGLPDMGTIKRDETQHCTVTVVLYNTVAGGVPSEADVTAAIDDMEQLYTACKWSGQLADAEAAFMKEELTVKDAIDIHHKVTEQPYKPAVVSVANAAVFPE